ncbi:Uma2 family endonuclease [Kitasatospora sp. NPDC089509]|uniref:Uma2 family endonuclease n=1 Tax=Kitasatospora sp. NPDC089509 TaxID=3364079 RepID=UPI003800FAA7
MQVPGRHQPSADRHRRTCGPPPRRPPPPRGPTRRRPDPRAGSAAQDPPGHGRRHPDRDHRPAGAGTTLCAHDIVVAIEIASPSTRVADKKMRPSLYAAAGIEHYWRLELDPAPRLYLGHLERGLYVDRLVRVGETTALTDPFPLDLDAARLRR